MVQSERGLQSLGICHRLFCFIMKTFAAQALKPVTLGRPEGCSLWQQPISTNLPGDHRPPCEPAGEDFTELSETSASVATATTCISNIFIDGEVTSPFHAPKENDSSADQVNDLGAIMSEKKVDSKMRAPKKMVSIKEEAEVIQTRKKRKLIVEGQVSSAVAKVKDEESKPLRSILKSGSNVDETSTAPV